MATTPAAGGENGSFIPPGTSVMLHATICNESEGMSHDITTNAVIRWEAIAL